MLVLRRVLRFPHVFMEPSTQDQPFLKLGGRRFSGVVNKGPAVAHCLLFSTLVALQIETWVVFFPLPHSLLAIGATSRGARDLLRCSNNTRDRGAWRICASLFGSPLADYTSHNHLHIRVFFFSTRKVVLWPSFLLFVCYSSGLLKCQHGMFSFKIYFFLFER